MKWVIFAGRFQPFHIGHFDVVRQSLRLIEPDDIFVLGAVAPMPIIPEVIDENFVQIASEHHLPERNPWPLPVRLLALSSVAYYFQERNPYLAITHTAIPRPDFGWELIRSWFPGLRRWIIPSAGEMFDDEKEKFFRQLGEDVVRINDSTSVSGMVLREAWEKGETKYLKDKLPKCVHSAYIRGG